MNKRDELKRLEQALEALCVPHDNTEVAMLMERGNHFLMAQAPGSTCHLALALMRASDMAGMTSAVLDMGCFPELLQSIRQAVVIDRAMLQLHEAVLAYCEALEKN